MFRSLALLIPAMLLLPIATPPPQPSGPVVLSLLDQGWFEVEYREERAQELDQFKRETGIKVEMLPAPEDAPEQLTLWRSLLEKHSATPDVYAIDVIWPQILGDDLIDLSPYLSKEEIKSYFPQLIALNTVRGRLIGLPYSLSVGLLYYRRDLLRAYGYPSPPSTWDELERMANKIQSGERAKGHKDFWGYIWSGAQTEALVCNALEWQASEGGGTIVNQAGLVDVNNPRAIFSWQRASRWIGAISPPSVTAYDEFDEINSWQAGRAAFMRNWSNPYGGISGSNKAIYDKTGAAILPAGSAGHASTLGGNAFGVSRYSQHREEAVRLVRFLCRRDVQRRRSLKGAQPPTIPDLYRDPQLKAANSDFEQTYESIQRYLTLRPSQQSGLRYPEIAAAYARAVHSVLTKERVAATAARELQDEFNRRRRGP